MFGSQLLMMRC